MTRRSFVPTSYAAPVTLLIAAAAVTFVALAYGRDTGWPGDAWGTLALGLVALLLAVPWVVIRRRRRSRLRALRRGIAAARARAVRAREDELRERAERQLGALELLPFEEDRAELRGVVGARPRREGALLVVRHELEHVRRDEEAWRGILDEPAGRTWREPAAREALTEARGRLDSVEAMLDAVQLADAADPDRAAFLLRDALRLWCEARYAADAAVPPSAWSGRSSSTDGSPAAVGVAAGWNTDSLGDHWFDQHVPEDPACGDIGTPTGGSPAAWCDSGAWGSSPGSDASVGDGGSFGGGGHFDSGTSWDGGGDVGGGDSGGGGGDSGGGGGGD